MTEIKTPHVFVGREYEAAIIADTVVNEGPEPVLMLRGEPGVGKSAILRQAERTVRAGGGRVLRSWGVEAETDLSFSGLHQLLHPILGFADSLSERRQAAIRSALGFADGPVPDHLLLCASVLDLLLEASVHEVLLMTIDDVQWWDRASTDVMAFVARRLTGTRCSLLLSLRNEATSEFESYGLRQIEVFPLSPALSEALIDGLYPSLDPVIRRRVLREAEGNPLAIEELPKQPLEERSEMAFGHLNELSLTRRLEGVFAGRIDELSAEAQTDLLRAAMDGAIAGIMPSGVMRGAYKPTAPKEAISLGLIAREDQDGTLVFRHPLVRSAVIQRASPQARREANLHLAQTFSSDPERYAWHLASASTAPDESVSRALVVAGKSAARRGGMSSAIACLLRASEFASVPEESARLRAEAAYLAHESMQLSKAEKILAEGDSATSNDVQMGASIAALYVQMNRSGEVLAAQRMLMDIARSIEDPKTLDPEILERLLHVLVIVSHLASTDDLWAEVHAEFARLGGNASSVTLVLLDAFSRLPTDLASIQKGIAREVNALGPNTLPAHRGGLMLATELIDELDTYGGTIRSAIDTYAVSGGAINSLMVAYMVRTIQLTALGEHVAAEETALHGIELAKQAEHSLFEHWLLCFLSAVHAQTGQTRQSEAIRKEIEAWARPRGVGLMVNRATNVAALNSIAIGDFESAYLNLRERMKPGVVNSTEYQPHRRILDFTEAAWMTGRTEEARMHVEAFLDWGPERFSTRPRMQLFAAAGMTSLDAASAEWFEKAFTVKRNEQFPFDIARIRLIYGAKLRRSREVSDARQQLRCAADEFSRMGAMPWLDRALVELRATGESTVARSPEPHPELTSQESAIAALAAAGLTNQEIGERLYLSPRTVGAHLYRIFPKLGVASRTELRDVL